MHVTEVLHHDSCSLLNDNFIVHSIFDPDDVSSF